MRKYERYPIVHADSKIGLMIIPNDYAYLTRSRCEQHSIHKYDSVVVSPYFGEQSFSFYDIDEDKNILILISV